MPIVTIAEMLLVVFRGMVRIIAALTGLLLVYGTVFSMEAMTTRIPVGAAREAAISSLFMLPWILLLCSGFDDLGRVANQPWVFWSGAVAGLLLLSYFERHTGSSIATKIVMPVAATAGGVLPHAIRRIRFVFLLCSVVAGIGGIIILYFAFKAFITPGISFATTAMAILFVGFGITATLSGVLAVVPFHQCHARSLAG